MLKNKETNNLILFYIKFSPQRIREHGLCGRNKPEILNFTEDFKQFEENSSNTNTTKKMSEHLKVTHENEMSEILKMKAQELMKGHQASEP